MTVNQDTATLIARARSGSRDAVDALLPRLYDQLRQVAHARLANRRQGDTLSTTDLVHETYLRLVDSSAASWTDEAHFFALASRAMRFVLVDLARARAAEKRGAGQPPVTLDGLEVGAVDRPEELLAIDEALDALTKASERLGTIVQYRFFGGMSHEEVAEVTGYSVPTVKRDWARARAWLYHFVRGESTGGPGGPPANP
jgi:RNA polymerase sigma factor (TIGR02999 family)